MARFSSFEPWSVLSFFLGGGGWWKREIIVQFYILSKIVDLKRRDKGQAEVKHIQTREK